MASRSLFAHAEDVTIGVFGMGYVGLPTALGFAELGWRVIGADIDANKIARLKNGDIPFYEPGLDTLLKKHLGSEDFLLTADVDAALRASTVLFLCVGTPQRDDGAADLGAIESLARAIACNLNGYKLIVEKSTVPALTGQWLRRTVIRHAVLHKGNGHGNGHGKPNGNGHAARNGNGNGNGHGNGHSRAEKMRAALAEIDFDVASNPEFLQEGRALENFFHPDRVVCGVTSQRAKDILGELYRPLNCPILFTDLTTAEVIKHAANAFLATKISFINLVADICETVGADVTQVAAGIGMDPRIGMGFLQAGIGFGGYCLPKDLRAFIHLAEERNVDASLLRAGEAINQRRVEHLIRKIRQGLWILDGKTIAVLGLAFKGGTDDLRDAPALKVIAALRREGVNLRLYDPKAMPNARYVVPEVPGRLVYCDNPYEAAQGAHALLVLNESEEFRQLRFSRLRKAMQMPLVVDGRNVFSPNKVREAGFEYISMGRASCDPLEEAEPGNDTSLAGTELPAVPRAREAAKRGGHGYLAN